VCVGVMLNPYSGWGSGSVAVGNSAVTTIATSDASVTQRHQGHCLPLGQGFGVAPIPDTSSPLGPFEPIWALVGAFHLGALLLTE